MGIEPVAFKRKPTPVEELEAPEFSEDAIALTFAEGHASDLRYVAAWGKWLEFDGTRWCMDATLRAYDLVALRCLFSADAER